MSALSAQIMTGLLTEPYRRGGETLEMTLLADAGGFTVVSPYDFGEYKARYQANPEKPQYLIYVKKNIPSAGVQLEIRFQFLGTESSCLVTVPGGTFAGTSFAVPIPDSANQTLRLTRFRQTPVTLPGPGLQNFGIVALLGNIAKLSWVMGWEKDQIRSTLKDVQLQRHVAFAHDASLDALGTDLRVPRFPPRQYSFDPNTIALYHLDDVVANGGAVKDDTTRFGLTGHPGVNLMAQSGVSGKFGHGFLFGPAGAIEIPTHADFDLTAVQSFTVEAFLQADSASVADPALIVGKGTLDNTGGLTTSGWSLMMGTFRGFSGNLRWTVTDGAQKVELFADANLADGQFHHLAGVIDRTSQRTRLLVDGEVVALADISAIAALTNAVPIRLGLSTSSKQQLAGVVDEVRFSNIARTDFDSVLGEGDANYRQRLGIFRRWQVPNSIDLLATINSQIQINGQPNSFVLTENTKPGATASALVRAIPGKIVAGESIMSDGKSPGKESDASGGLLEDPPFKDIYLLRHDSPAVDYGALEGNRRMQTVTAEVLDALLQLLASATPPIPGLLLIKKSYDPTNTGLHSVGRALRLAHQTLTLEQLAVFAHRAGFGFVSNTGVEVYASVASGERLRIVVEPRAAAEIPVDGSDAFAGHVFDLHLAQDGLPVAGLYRWIIIPWGSGSASLHPHPSDPVTMSTPVENRPHVRVSADAPGDLTLRVEYTLARTTVTGTRDFTFTISSLADNSSITADGSRSESETSAVGRPTGTLNQIYLITPTLTLNYGADPNNKLMQTVLETPLKRLAVFLAANATTLQIVKAFDPADTGFFKLGRALRLTHPTVDPGLLGALAHQAGFDFVARTGTQIYCSVADGEKVQIANAADLSLIPAELIVGKSVNLQARFTTLPAAGSYNWSTSEIGNGQGSFDFVLRPKVSFKPTRTGIVQLSMSYLEDDPKSVGPYTFEIRLNDALNIPATIIPKNQYDLLMNILNYFHPIGVEVVTRQIREHVVEVRENLLNAFPGYTFPDFRM